jgi:transaldolase
MTSLQDLNIKIFADGANLNDIASLAENPLIKGFTTNPTLMHKANVPDYKAFSLEVLSIIGDRPVSFEVFSDDFLEMERQANEIASWGDNIYVKIPVTNTLGQFAGPLVQQLSNEGVHVNVTALMTTQQVERVAAHLSHETPSIVSVFAGRVADTGRDPVPAMADSVQILKSNPMAELIWASPRELLNIFQADSIGCQIITVTSDVLAKLHLVGKDLDDYSLETAKMFRLDALAAGYSIQTDNAIPMNTRSQA